MAEHDHAPEEKAAEDEKRLEDLEVPEDEAADVKGGIRNSSIGRWGKRA
jgi:hypothetical protein